MIVIAALVLWLGGSAPLLAQSPGDCPPPLADGGCVTQEVVSPFTIGIAGLYKFNSEEIVSMSAEEWLLRYAETYTYLAQALEDSGADWTRVFIDWSVIQPDDPELGGEYNWYPYYDVKLALVGGTGVQMIGTISQAPDWAAETNCSPIYEDRLDDFTQFLTDLVNRYKQPPYNIHHWELFNEPDGVPTYFGESGWGCWASVADGGARYTQMAAAASQAIKAADPTATVLMGGIAYDFFYSELTGEGRFDRYFVDEMMAAGAADYLDGVNFHYFPDFAAEWERWLAQNRSQNGLSTPTCGDYYDGEGQSYEPTGPDLRAKATHFQERLQTCFGVDKPLWITELGAHHHGCYPEGSDNCWDEHKQARYILQGYARGLAAGAVNITYFALTTPNSTAEQGLLSNDWEVRPAFYAYQTMVSELENYRHSQILDLTGGEGYRFEHSCAPDKVVAWGDSGLVTVDNARQARVMQYTPAQPEESRWVESTVIDGSPNDLDDRPNYIGLGLSEDPFYAAGRDIRVSPARLFFRTGSDNPSPQSFVVDSYGSTPLSWVAPENISWLTLGDSAGTTPATVPVSVDITGLVSGTYTGTITVSSAGAWEDETVEITLAIGSMGTGSIDPVAGGVITTPDGSVALEFPGGAVTQTTSVTVTVVEAIPYLISGFEAADRTISIEATGSNGEAVATFQQPFTLTLAYPTSLNETKELELNLYFWNCSEWQAIQPCPGCRDTANNTLTILTDRTNELVLMLPLQPLYLPIIIK